MFKRRKSNLAEKNEKWRSFKDSRSMLKCTNAFSFTGFSQLGRKYNGEKRVVFS